MIRNPKMQIHDLFGKLFLRRQPNMEPFTVTNTCLLGQRMKFINHLQDQVLGAMLRGEKLLCPHFQAEIAWLKEQIRPDDFVLDAGGNIGSVSMALSFKESKAFICTFEPDPLNYGLLQMNLALNGCRNVFAFNFALGDSEDMIDFYISPDNFGDHRSSKPKGLDLRESEFTHLPMPVSKIRASEFLKQFCPDRPLDLVKIDTQGADFEILEDILPLLKPDGKIAIEFSPYHIDTNGTSRQQVFDLLSKFRFIQIIKPESHGSYSLEETNCNELRQFYDDQCSRYKKYYDLALLK